MCILIPVLLNVAFFTLIERKILGLRQRRKGPNKVRIFGLLQPIADAIKLFLKEKLTPNNRLWPFLVGPIGLLSVALTMWLVCPSTGVISININVFLFLVVLRFGIYPLFIIGWASNSKYGLVGSLRGVAQTVSYEIRLAFLIGCFLLILNRINLFKWNSALESPIVIFNLRVVFLIWLITLIAETNRTPFDFSEGESELVSGFNIEYGRGLFALIFMGEYTIIILFSYLTRIILSHSINMGSLQLILLIFFIFFWVWIRTTFPRHRYDKLIELAWKTCLPLVLTNFLLLSLTSIIYDNMRTIRSTRRSFSFNGGINFFSWFCHGYFSFHYKICGVGYK